MRIEGRYRIVLVNGSRFWADSVAWDYAGVTVTRTKDATSWARASESLPVQPTSTLYPWPSVRQVDDYRDAFERQQQEAEEAVKGLDPLEDALGQGRR